MRVASEHDFDISDFVMGRILKLKKNAVRWYLGMTPAIALCNPKYPHNVGGAVRAASCFGAKAVIFSGDRIIPKDEKNYRLPREERLKGYKDVFIFNDDYFFDRFTKIVTPVAVEVRKEAEPLTTFQHPEYPLYVFGPEDGGLTRTQLRHCHRFVTIPSKHCLSLAQAVSIILYDRSSKL